MTFIEALGLAAMLVGFVVSIFAWMHADQANRRSARTRIQLDLIQATLDRHAPRDRALVPRWGDEWMDGDFSRAEQICRPIGPMDEPVRKAG